MQSTEATDQKRPDLDALIQEVITSTFRDRYTAKEAKSLAMELAAALAAERDRADRAEAVIEEIRNAITTTDEGWMIADDDKLAEILEAAQ